MSADSTAVLFAGAARRVQQRIFLRRLFGVMARLAAPVAGAGLAMLLVSRLSGWRLSEPGLVVVLLVAWIASALAMAWRGRPGEFAALAAWDAAAGRRELFASAWAFEQSRQSGAGAALHLSRATSQLPGALRRLGSDLPLPLRKSASSLWLALLCAAPFVPWLKPAISAPQIMSPEMARRAEQAAEELKASQGQALAQLQGLDPKEREAIAALESSFKDAGAALAQTDGRPVEHVLASLEDRAAAAEALARDIGADTEVWASEALLAELRRHADTAPLSDAVRDKNAAEASKHATELESLVRGQPAAAKPVRRIESALSRIGEFAGDADRAKPLGRHMVIAGEELSAQKPDGAAREFAEMAAQFARMARRHEAQRKLEKLAQELRKSAGDIAGAKSSGKGERKSAADGKSLSHVPKGKIIEAPGFLEESDEGADEVPDSTQPGDDEPLLIAPRPGKEPEGEPDPDKPQALIAGQNRNARGDNNTGDAPGEGRNKADENKEDPLKAGKQGIVAATANAAGDSSKRAVKSAPRAEEGKVAARKQAAEFLRTQEAALDSESIPPARREMVRRYFQALREQFDAAADNRAN